MKEPTRFRLKHSTGWFAAGREVACALPLLSDAAFKLFIWLCLHAERSRGVVSATPTELARALGKKETDLQVALAELLRQGVCTLAAEGVIRISDRFWPYQRSCDAAASDGAHRYVEAVKGIFLSRRCVQSSFTAADERLALSLYRRNIALIHVEHAILLGAARKYAAWLQHPQGTAISSLHYFTDLFEEVQREPSAHYWTYVAHKVETFERKWVGFAARQPEDNKHGAEGQKGGCYRSTESEIVAPNQILMPKFLLNHTNNRERRKEAEALGKQEKWNKNGDETMLKIVSPLA